MTVRSIAEDRPITARRAANAIDRCFANWNDSRARPKNGRERQLRKDLRLLSRFVLDERCAPLEEEVREVRAFAVDVLFAMCEFAP